MDIFLKVGPGLVECTVQIPNIPECLGQRINAMPTERVVHPSDD
jgi:hypothetical protein